MNDTRSHRAANIALLIDADNASPDAIDPVLTVLAELGTVNIRRIYGNWSKSALGGWAKLVHRYALQPEQQFDLTKGKNATDMAMTIDAMDLLYSGKVDGYGIMSSDSDFTPLVTRIRQEGVPAYGFGNGNTPEAFRQACTRFIDVAALVAVEAQEEPPADKREVDAELLNLLVDAYNNVKRDENGFASLSSVGQRAGNRSSFDVRNYGFKRLSDLIQSIPNFVTEQRAGGAMFVKRVH